MVETLRLNKGQEANCESKRTTGLFYVNQHLVTRGEQLLTRFSGLLLLARLRLKNVSPEISGSVVFLCYINHNLKLHQACACQPLCQHQQTISNFPRRVRRGDPQGSGILNLLRHAPSVA